MEVVTAAPKSLEDQVEEGKKKKWKTEQREEILCECVRACENWFTPLIFLKNLCPTHVT